MTSQTIAKLFLILFGMLFGLSSTLKAGDEDDTFEHLGAREGLSHNSGLSMVTDRLGFLWIGTQNGLNRYDGYAFKKYFHDPRDSTSLSGSYINSLYLDKMGIIWVGTNKGGLDYYDRFHDHFIHIQHRAEDPYALGKGSIYAMAEDSAGHFWVGVNPSGLFRLDRKEKRFFLVPTDSTAEGGFRGKRVYALYTDHRGALWVGSDKGLSQMLNSATLTLQPPQNAVQSTGEGGSRVNIIHPRFRHWSYEPDNPNSLVSNTVHSIYAPPNSRGNILWVGTWDGLSQMVFDGDGGIRFQNFRHEPKNPLSISSNMIWSMRQDRSGRLWVGTQGGGVNRFDPASGNFKRFQQEPRNPLSFSGRTVRCIHEDNSGILWFGSANAGLNRRILRDKPFRSFQHDPDDPYSLSDNEVSTIWEDMSGDLWVGTKYGGLNFLKASDRSAGRFQHYRHDPKDPGSLLHDQVRAVHRDRKGTLWVASWDIQGGLNLLEPGKQRFRHFQNIPTNPASLADNQVKTIAEDLQGNLWFGMSEAGLDRFSSERQDFIHFSYDPTVSNGISDYAVMHLYVDHEGLLWISTFSGGLNRYNPKEGTFTRFLPNPDNPASISHNRVWSVYEDHRNRIWVGSNGGLDLYNRANEHFTRFSEKDGLCNNTVYGILEDDHGNLWVSTQDGLAKCELLPKDALIPQHIRFINFDIHDGLPGNEFNSGAFLRSRSGELFFGGVKGLLHFYPDSILENPNPPSVVVTSFKVFEKDLPLDSAINEKKRIDLSHKQNFFSFEFAALDFQEPRKNQYAYRVEGLTEEWIYCGTRRYVNFSNVDPGEYKLEIKASNRHNVWNEEGAAIAIHIHPPFWMTTWFRWSVGLILLTALVTGARLIGTRKIRKQMRKLEIRQRLQSERERISRELHDHIGANLSDITAGLEISRRYLQMGQSHETESQLSFLEKHTRNTINDLRDTIWALQLNATSLANFEKRLQDYLHNRRHFKKATEIIIQSEFINEQILTPEQSFNLFRISQEALNNAIKHANAKRIIVKIMTRTANEITIHIQDDGMGFESPAKGSSQEGFGLSNMRRRAEKINARFDVQTSPGQGTCISVTLNVQSNANSSVG